MEITEEQILGLLAKISDRGAKAVGERAIEALYLEFHRLVRNFIWNGISQDMTLIEEVVQDTFMEVWKHPERFRGDAKFKTWLLGIARHKALDLVRKNRKDHDPLETVEEQLEAVEPPIIEKIQEGQVQNAILSCLEQLGMSGKLSPEHKQVLHLAYVEDQTINEIAEMLACVENTIKTRLHYARLRIKNCIKLKLAGAYEHG